MTESNPVAFVSSTSLPEMSDVAFQAIVSIAKREAGLMIGEKKRALVQSRISRRLRALDLVRFEDYVDRVVSKHAADELSFMISALTTNVSSFFREAHHFDQLRDTILPAAVERARSGGRVRIWSAGCSTGQEPYSVAMEILTQEPRAGQFDIRILASDIDQNVLEKAKSGVYDADNCENVPLAFRDKFLQQRPDDTRLCEVQKDVRALVSFRRLNLLKDWPMRGTFDVIFCRNVVIYFDEDTQKALWPRFRRALTDDGTLFVGHSERIVNPGSLGFRPDGVTSYRAV